MQDSFDASIEGIGKFSRVDPDNFVALGHKPFVTNSIACLPDGREVMFAVNFNDETMLVNDKVRDVRTNWGLLSHMYSVEPAKLPQFRP